MKLLLGLALSLLISLHARADAPPADPADSIELHAHLFMKEGMTFAFRGGFNDPLRASSWRDRFRSMGNPQALDRSGLRVLVAVLYAHPLMVTNMRESIRRQLDLAEEFVKSHPDWIIARTATEARQAIARGKRVMILALEGASGILENDRDVEEFVNRRGIRIVNLLHLTDDRFGGVAFLKGILALSSPFAWVRSVFSPRRSSEGVRINDHGLTEEGRRMARSLISHGVWLDLAHASDLAQEELVPLLQAARQPLLHTHTVLRRFFPVERAISDSQLEKVRESQGVVGLMPTEDMLEGTPVNPRYCPAVCQGPCDGGIPALATHYEAAVHELGPDAVSLGSDYNGGVRHLKPFCAGASGTELDRSGLWNMGQIAEIWQALRAVRAPVPKPLNRTVDYFLKAWGRVAP